MEKLPDFYLEMKWDFESSIIPLISHIAPSGLFFTKFLIFIHSIDTFKIWKYKNSIRVDYNLVGMKNLKTKRRDMSIIFNPTNNVLEREDVKEFHTDELANVMWLVNKSHNTFTNPLVLNSFSLNIILLARN